jgi:hypothetical protein
LTSRELALRDCLMDARPLIHRLCHFGALVDRTKKLPARLLRERGGTQTKFAAAERADLIPC